MRKKTICACGHKCSLPKRRRINTALPSPNSDIWTLNHSFVEEEEGEKEEERLGVTASPSVGAALALILFLPAAAFGA